MIKPLLAAKCPPSMTMDDFLAGLSFPLGATPKIDGIRCITLPDGKGRAWGASRTLKPIPNRHIQRCLSSLPVFLDGELTVGTNFQAATSGIMSQDGEPNFTYWVFGNNVNEPELTYRTVSLGWDLLLQMLGDRGLGDFCRILYPKEINNLDELLEYETYCLANGAEGVMLRDYDKGYKYGRSTLKEQKLVAIKRFVDSEAEVFGFEELYHNRNEPITNNLGHTERSSHQDNLEPADMLGALRVRDKGVEFKIGSGFTVEQRQYIWQRREVFLGKLCKYKYQPHGVKDKPRAPIFLGWRHLEDV